MPPVPATAEVSPIELDGVSKLKVEVLFSKRSELARTHKLNKGLSWQKCPSSCVCLRLGPLFRLHRLLLAATFEIVTPMDLRPMAAKIERLPFFLGT